MPIKESAQEKYYIMVALLKAAHDYAEDILTEKEVSYDHKQLLSRISKDIESFYNSSQKRMPANHRAVWNEEWNRDYLSFVNILRYAIDMDDNKRNLSEDMMLALLKGEIKVEKE